MLSHEEIIDRESKLRRGYTQQMIDDGWTPDPDEDCIDCRKQLICEKNPDGCKWFERMEGDCNE